MKRFASFKFTFIGVILLSISVFAADSAFDIFGNNYSKGFPGNKYTQEWFVVDSLDNVGMYKEALQKVQAIYGKAKAEKNTPQIVKTLIYSLKYKSTLEEDAQETFLKDIDAELASADLALKYILYSLKAEFIWSVYQNNMWIINERTATDDKSEGMASWDAQKFMDESRKYYMLSLENEAVLKEIPIENIEDILVKDFASRPLRPTLFDFLAHRAIDHFMNSQSNLNKPVYAFELDDPAYFNVYSEFIKLNPNTQDSLSSNLFTIRLFKSVLSFHSKSGNNAALVDVDLKRLQYVYDNYVGADKDKLYLAALVALEARFKEDKESAEVKVKLADLYYSLGNSYKTEEGEIDKKYYNKKAATFCEEIIKNYPDAICINHAKNILASIKAPFISSTTENTLAPDVPNLMLFNYRNIDKAYFKIVAVNYDEFTKRMEMDTDSFRVWLSKQPSQKTWNQNIPNDGLYHEHSTELEIEPLKKGFHVLMMNHKDDFTSTSTSKYVPLFISNIAYIKRHPYGKGIFEAVIVKRDSGIPIKGAEVKLFKKIYDYNKRIYKSELVTKLISDATGHVIYTYDSYKTDNYTFQVRAGDDFIVDEDYTYFYKYNDKTVTTTKTSFFTDRGIYRPGQTIYFKGIKIKTDGQKNDLVTNIINEVIFKDANGQEITKIKLSVNEFGSFQGSFVIPQGLSTGTFSISDKDGYKSVSVEEYKRPKFEVTVEKPTDVFRVNDKIKVMGSAKALAGFNITDAKVQYRVYRTANYPIWYRSWYPINTEEQEITYGKTKTDDKGEFIIIFDAIPDKSVSETSDPIFNYRVSVEITDDAGETRTAEETIAAGYKTITVSAIVPALMDANHPKPWDITVNNLNGKEQKQPVLIKIEKLQKTILYRPRLWENPDMFLIEETDFKKNFPNEIYKNDGDKLLIPAEEVVYNNVYNTADSIDFIYPLNNLKSGEYRTIITTNDIFGKEVKGVYFFTVYNEKEKTSPVNEFLFASPIKSTVEPGSEATFYLTSSKNIKVLYEIEHNQKIIKKELISLNNEQKIISIPIIEDYRGNIHVTFSAIYQGRSYLQAFTVVVPYTNKQLKVKLESYRDKMLPGSKEEWKINVAPLLGQKETAELLLGMYDASLDAFSTNDWFLNVWNSRGRLFTWISATQKIKKPTELNYEQQEYFDESSINYEYLNWFGYAFWRQGYTDRFFVNEGSRAITTIDELKPGEFEAREKAADGKQQKLVMFAAPKVAADKSGSVAGNTKNAEQEETRNEPNAVLVKARSNFNETAFFFPQIKTDENGNALFSFTMPESLTKWKFMGLAHTQSLQVGNISQEVVTQKELMINTFAPRFLREGDELFLTGKVTNLTEKELIGKAVLELKNPLTDQSIASEFGLIRAEIPFSVKQGQSVPVEWKIKIPFGQNLVKYSVKAISDEFSDGEENVLPILTNRMLVTETLPLWVNGNDTKKFSLPKLNTSSPTLKSHKLTLEFTSNPTWYAIQSLPYLMEYPYECAEQTFSRLYANSIATHIANSDPKIKAVFDTWKNYQPQALQSKLEQNQELKNILLEETPWVREANNESERKRRVGILFDINRMKNEIVSNEKKLFDMQTPNGGFPWFKGGPDDRYITQHIVTGFGKLSKLGVKEGSNNYALRSAVMYLDLRIAEDYKSLIKDKVDLKQDNLNHIQIQYLYARSFFKDIPVNENCTEEVAYYFSQAEKYWIKKDDFSQGMLALAMHRAEKKTIAKQIAGSLKSRSIYNEELGMYWKGMLQGGYYWYNAPIETMALMIEMFDEVTDDSKSVNDMRRWLLKNKQTNDWKTTKATADASYALLLQGTDLLMTEPGVEISFGVNGEMPFTLSDDKKEAGTGYFKKSFDQTEIKPQMANVRITKKTEGPGFGSIYWQYFEEMDKIKKPSIPNPLLVTKKLFREVKTDNGVKLEEVFSTTQLETGDRIISRIIFTSDRPMEYIHLKDMRASGLEPENILSEYKWKQGLGYYESTRDVATHFFISYVPRGTFVFEYLSRVTHKGNFSNGITQVQCMYAPEFTFHSEGIRLNTN